MLSESIINTSGGKITEGIELENSIKSVLFFIKEHFESFAIRNENGGELNEKGLSQKLCIYLNKKAKKQPFFFHSEFMEDTSSGTSPQVDIGIISDDDAIVIANKEYSDEDSFFSMEAKRLPTPGSNRQKEYVIGYESPKGAIERFKRGIHGSQLKYAAIIGYIQKENFEHWFLKINSWIEELATIKDQTLWTKEDRIAKINSLSNNNLAELTSLHSRVIKGRLAEKIKLFHFWINLISTSVKS